MILLKILGRQLASAAKSTEIVIGDSGLTRLKKILKPNEFLRIDVESGGCSGFSYKFDIQPSNNLDQEEDLIFEREDYRVVINKHILGYLKGSKLEYNDTLIKSSFQLTNPVASNKCGCGSSFSVDLDKFERQ